MYEQQRTQQKCCGRLHTRQNCGQCNGGDKGEQYCVATSLMGEVLREESKREDETTRKKYPREEYGMGVVECGEGYNEGLK